jgi:hypothetical protein
LSSSTSSHARRYDIFIARAAADIDWCWWIWRSSSIFPGPISPTPGNVRRIQSRIDAGSAGLLARRRRSTTFDAGFAGARFGLATDIPSPTVTLPQFKVHSRSPE